MTRYDVKSVISEMNRINIFHSEGIYCIELGQVWKQKSGAYIGRKVRILKIRLEKPKITLENVHLLLEVYSGSLENFESNKRADEFLKEYKPEEE